MYSSEYKSSKPLNAKDTKTFNREITERANRYLVLSRTTEVMCHGWRKTFLQDFQRKSWRNLRHMFLTCAWHCLGFGTNAVLGNRKVLWVPGFVIVFAFRCFLESHLKRYALYLTYAEHLILFTRTKISWALSLPINYQANKQTITLNYALDDKWIRKFPFVGGKLRVVTNNILFYPKLI